MSITRRVAPRLLVTGFWLSGLCGGTTLLACAPPPQAGGTDVQRLTHEVESLRRQTDEDRAAMKAMENRIYLLEDRLATALVQLGKTPDTEPNLPAALPGSPDVPIVLTGGTDEPRHAYEPPDDGKVTVVDVDSLGSPGAGAPSASTSSSSSAGARTKARRGPAAIPHPSSPGSTPTFDDKGLPDAPAPKSTRKLAVVPLPKDDGTRPPPVAVTAPKPRSDEAVERYRTALGALQRHEHEPAIAGFKSFLADFPNHDYADNAQYWLGEAYYDQADFKTALIEFRAVIKRYPDGNKAPDALLKVGYCYAKLGDLAAARDVLSQVVQIYPKTNAALLAEKRLGELRE